MLKDLVRTILKTLLFAVLLLFFVQPVIVKETSMLPTYEDGDHLLVSKVSAIRGKLPEYGDVIVFRSSLKGRRLLIKRVIGLPGDTITIAGGCVYRNGDLLNEDYLYEQGVTCADKSEYAVGGGEVFCMGDNREMSIDSRDEEVGNVKTQDIVGKAAVRLFPVRGSAEGE